MVFLALRFLYTSKVNLWANVCVSYYYFSRSIHVYKLPVCLQIIPRPTFLYPTLIGKDRSFLPRTLGNFPRQPPPPVIIYLISLLHPVRLYTQCAQARPRPFLLSWKWAKELQISRQLQKSEKLCDFCLPLTLGACDHHVPTITSYKLCIRSSNRDLCTTITLRVGYIIWTNQDRDPFVGTFITVW